MVSFYWYCGLVAAVAIERLIELAISRRNYRAAMAAGAVEASPRHFTAMATMHPLFLLACAGEAYFRKFDASVGVPALVLVFAAQAMRYWVVLTLGSRWNVRIVVFPGKPLVTHGPYRFLRHPNYLAVIVEIVALPLVHGAWITATLFSLANAIVLAVRIPAEEAALRDGRPQR